MAEGSDWLPVADRSGVWKKAKSGTIRRLVYSPWTSPSKYTDMPISASGGNDVIGTSIPAHSYDARSVSQADCPICAGEQPPGVVIVEPRQQQPWL